jgi:hypothetical protein
MINIDDKDLDDETLEEKVFEKADYIGEVLTGERKIKFALPQRKQQIKKIKPKKPSQLKLFITSLKHSFKKYREMSLARLLGMSIIFILSISTLSIVGYLLYLLLKSLLRLGIIGLIGFAIFMCASSLSMVLLIASRYTRK